LAKWFWKARISLFQSVVNFSSIEQKETGAPFIKMEKKFSRRVKSLQTKTILAVSQTHFRVGIGIA
jgi:hypothetical protein